MIRTAMFALIAFFVWASTSNAFEFKGVARLLKVDELDMNNSFNASLIYTKCAAAYGGLAKFLPEEDDALRNKAFQKSMQYLSYGIVILSASRDSKDAAKQQLTDIYLDNVVWYFSILQNNQNSSGSIFDEFYSEEIEICRLLINES